jgi:ribosome-associated toxin RatA of RatAB toxin-antitoxin module
MAEGETKTGSEHRRQALARIIGSALALSGALTLLFAPTARGCGLRGPSCVASIAASREVISSELKAQLAALRPDTRQADRGRGHVLSGTEEGWDAVAVVPIAARPEAVWSVLTSFERWPEVFPSISEVSIRTRDDGRVELRQSSGKFGFEFSYTTLVTLNAGMGRVEQILDGSATNDVTEAHFVWQLIPVDERDTTIAILQARLDSGQPVPGFIRRKLLRRGALESMEALAAEVRRRDSATLLATTR